MTKPGPGETCRFAPSITGAAHPGTLLAALLCWLDARSRKATVLLRLEDLDTTRLREGQREAMGDALQWLGLDWDQVQVQSEFSSQHEQALDTLATSGTLYPCICSRKQWQARGKPAPDGGVAYDNLCRGRSFGPGGWRESNNALRVQLPGRPVLLIDEGGRNLGQSPALQMGDPVVRRRDGVIAYHLVVVVDDAASSVSRVVRGHDLASSTATQVLLQQLLGYAQPSYRHHLLLLEESQHKLAKMRGSLPYQELANRYSSAQVCGMLACAAGLRPTAGACQPQDLLTDFDWQKVRRDDQVFVVD